MIVFQRLPSNYIRTYPRQTGYISFNPVFPTSVKRNHDTAELYTNIQLKLKRSGKFIHSFVCACMRPSDRSFVRSPACMPTCPPSRPKPTHSLVVCLFVSSFLHSFIHLLTHSLTHLLTNSLTHSLTSLLTHFIIKILTINS